MNSFETKWVALSDTHCPFQEEKALEEVYHFISAYEPDYIVHCGDGVEGGAASKHANEYKHDLKDEYDAFNEVLFQLRECAPGATLVFLEGNHDSNILAEGRLPPDIRRVASPKVHVPELAYWKIFPYHNNKDIGVFTLGQIAFAHGYSASANAGRDEAIRFAPPNGLYIHGHTHRPEPVTQCVYGTKNRIDRWYLNLGTLGPIAPPYVRRLNSDGWAHAFAWGSCNAKRTLFASRQWEAHLEIL